MFTLATMMRTRAEIKYKNVGSLTPPPSVQIEHYVVVGSPLASKLGIPIRIRNIPQLMTGMGRGPSYGMEQQLLIVLPDNNVISSSVLVLCVYVDVSHKLSSTT